MANLFGYNRGLEVYISSPLFVNISIEHLLIYESKPYYEKEKFIF